ncbi:ABC transporter permease [Rariglobus hedericola]|uniref:ABC transporter permease subunit n=1 Tax=Rariglobus hedericola TaxID=2597822 RepID=A0A556QML6_9BACT|nr:ABC transporter permease subunit [Rariglobus hedericola]TSJ77873.1 ABC transporter permease subunit [Rariglobus hedericola]
MKRRILTFTLPVLTGLLLIAIWYVVRLWILSDDQLFLLPSPGAVARAFSEKWPQLWSATLNTAIGASLGFASAVLVSAGLALVLSLSPLVRAGLYPWLMALQLTPIIVFAPILILWVGAGLKSVVIITFLISFFPLVVNATQGLVSTDRNLIDLFRMGRASGLQQMFLLRIPAALPYFFTGLRIAAALAPIGAISGDMFAGTSGGGQGGLGFLAIIYSSQLQIPALFATAIISCLLGFVFAGAVIWLSWAALHRWHDSYQTKDS